MGFILVAIVFGAYWFAPRAPQNAITNFPSSGTDIIAFGDSLVEGVGSSEGKDFVSLLSVQIGQPIINLGVSGNTTADALARISELEKYHPKVVLLLLGGNDYIQRVPPEMTFTNLATIIQKIQASGAVVLLLGIRGGVVVDHFNQQFEQLRDTYKTAYVPDMLEGLFGNNQYMSDEVHPNDAGYAIIASRIYPVLQPLLK